MKKPTQMKIVLITPLLNQNSKTKTQQLMLFRKLKLQFTNK